MAMGTIRRIEFNRIIATPPAAQNDATAFPKFVTALTPPSVLSVSPPRTTDAAAFPAGCDRSSNGFTPNGRACLFIAEIGEVCKECVADVKEEGEEEENP
mmetsp:Transcript_39853/g.60196  ORF Transcript_39853/g.60196 Transcript_39853/m.60196 type:complete len:100 (-) Transcript_39853:123-422(-)